MAVNEDYEAGRRDGRIEALEQVQQSHAEKIDGLEKSLRIQERVVYGLIGAIGLIQMLPELKGILQ